MFLYILEDSSILWSDDAPSEDELFEIDDGILTVIDTNVTPPVAVKLGEIPKGVRVLDQENCLWHLTKDDAEVMIREEGWAYA